ncbi:MucR family transcriptional regulator [Blastococcus montanus]|uniref:MucR family transcriptional regulator n=1 Tax=Blastococcus montanus TaxID=3144973 RepID=UPI00320A9246
MPAHAEPHIPIGRLDDGTPVYGPPGRLTAVDGQRRVRCHICGALLAHVSADHLTRHGLTPGSYRRRYGLPPGPSLTAPGVGHAPPTTPTPPSWLPRRRDRLPARPAVSLTR